MNVSKVERVLSHGGEDAAAYFSEYLRRITKLTPVNPCNYYSIHFYPAFLVRGTIFRVRLRDTISTHEAHFMQSIPGGSLNPLFACLLLRVGKLQGHILTIINTTKIWNDANEPIVEDLVNDAGS